MAKIKFENGTTVNFDGNPTRQDIEEVANRLGLNKKIASQTQEKKPQGIVSKINTTIGGIGKSYGEFFKENIVKPITKPIVQSVAAIPQAASMIGPVSVAKMQKGETVEAPTYNLPLYGKIEPAKTYEEAVGRGVQSVAAGLSPATGGAAFMGGQAMTENKPVKEVTTEAVKGWLYGKAAEVVPKLLGYIGTKTGQTIKNLSARSIGIEPQTLSTITKNPEMFTKGNITNTTRPMIANEAKTAIESSMDGLSALGSGYDDIRNSNYTVKIPSAGMKSVSAKGKISAGTGLDEVLAKRGLQIKNGVLTKTADTIPMTNGDLAALQDFYNTFGKKETLTASQFLNARQTLDKMRNYEGTSNAVELMKSDLRQFYDFWGKQQIPGLQKLDYKYAPAVKELNALKKDYFKPNGDFKDGAINKIANLTGKGKDQVLARLEKVSPGITKKIVVLKAVEDIERAAGNKVGVYGRALGGVTGFALTGNLGVAAAAMITDPSIAVPILRVYGKASLTLTKPIDTMLNKIMNGAFLNQTEVNILKNALIFSAGPSK